MVDIGSVVHACALACMCSLLLLPFARLPLVVHARMCMRMRLHYARHAVMRMEMSESKSQDAGFGHIMIMKSQLAVVAVSNCPRLLISSRSALARRAPRCVLVICCNSVEINACDGSVGL